MGFTLFLIAYTTITNHMSSIFSLIHSLTPSEKRYFKLYAQRQVQGRNANYLKLFEAINNQENYDEDELLKRFRKETFVKQFSVAKNYLFSMLLKSLQEYNEENFIEWKIRNLFLQVKILASKGLDTDAARLIKKTKELAMQYEYYHVIMDVLHIEKYLFGNFRIYKQTSDVFAAIVDEDTFAFKMAEIHKDVGLVWHYLTLLEQDIGKKTFQHIKEEASKYVAVECMKEEPSISYNTKFRYYASWSLYYNLINDQQKNYECCRLCILIREEQIEKQPLQKMDPLASYYNFLIACEKVNQWEKFEYYLLKIKDYEAPTIEVNIRRMHNYCWCGLMYYLHLQDYEKANQIVKEYSVFFVEKKIKFRKDFKVYIEAACGLTCFLNKQYKEALYWWSDILNNTPEQVELRSQGAVRLYLMMLHCELETTGIMEYLAQQSKSFLKQTALWNEPEKLFVKGIVNISTINNKRERVTAFEKLNQQLNDIPISISGNALNKFIFNWLKQKAVGI